MGDSRLQKILILLAIISAGAVSPAWADVADEAYAEGIKASKQSNFEQAAEHFERARQAGRDTAALHHNLGVVYFRLRRYDQARTAFKRAAQTRRMQGLSYYNLGLVEQAAGNKEAARDWFQKARLKAETRQLRRLAENQLGIRPSPVSTYTVTPYLLYAEAFAGYDSNPRLAENADGVADDFREEGDSVFGAFAVGRYLLSGDWANGLAVYGDAYVSHYPDLDEEAVESFTAGLAKYLRTGEWQQRYQLGANHLRLGGEPLSNSLQASAEGERPLSENLRGELRLKVQYIEGSDSSGFDFLTGWQANLRARLKGIAGAWRWRVAYKFEYNDRDDLSVGDDFFSVSPIRHELEGDLERRLFGQLRGFFDAGYRLSRYRDAEVRNGDDQGERDDDRLSLGAGLAHPLGSDWTTRLELDYRDNSSNFDSFEYERTEVLLSVGRSF